MALQWEGWGVSEWVSTSFTGSTKRTGMHKPLPRWQQTVVNYNATYDCRFFFYQQILKVELWWECLYSQKKKKVGGETPARGAKLKIQLSSISLLYEPELKVGSPKWNSVFNLSCPHLCLPWGVSAEAIRQFHRKCHWPGSKKDGVKWRLPINSGIKI
jgi:hypothetical protein